MKKIVLLLVITAISIVAFSGFENKKVEEKNSLLMIGNPIYHLMLASEAEESWPSPEWALKPTSPPSPKHPLIEDVTYWVDMGLLNVPVDFIVRWKTPQGGLLKDRVYLDGSPQAHSWFRQYLGAWPLLINGIPNDAYMEVTWQSPANKLMNIYIGWHEDGTWKQEVILNQSVPNLRLTHEFLE